ncbi:MAG: hypothetical protein E4G96_04120 [Chrysiogenales bacterium]|nr:MAG: hypothetical protein E4G96_04120 [Chrysiogenales bacterium]
MKNEKKSDHELKLELLRGVGLFATLKELEMDVVAQNSGVYRFRQGDVLFREGKRGEGLYVIME